MEGQARTVVSALAIVTAGQCPAFLTGALAVQIRQDVGFSAAGLGLAVGAFFVASAVGSGVLGHLVEGVGWRRGMRIAVMVSAAALMGIASIRSWPTLVAFMVLGGLANAMGQPAANLSLVRMVPAQRHGLVFGVKQSAIPMATLLGGLAVPLVALTVGWRWTYVIVAAAAVLAMATVPSAPPVSEPAGSSSSRPPRRTVTDAIPSLAVLVAISVAGGLGSMVGNALGAFLVSSAVDGGVAEGAAGLLLATGSIAGLSMRVFLGWFADRTTFRPLRIMAVLLVLGGAGCLLLTGDRLPLLTVGTVLGFGAGWAWPGLFNLAVVRSHRRVPALATGITQTGVYVGAATGPMLFGAVVERASYATAWGATAVVAMLAAVLILISGAALSGGD